MRTTDLVVQPFGERLRSDHQHTPVTFVADGQQVVVILDQGGRFSGELIRSVLEMPTLLGGRRRGCRPRTEDPVARLHCQDTAHRLIDAPLADAAIAHGRRYRVAHLVNAFGGIVDADHIGPRHDRQRCGLAAGTGHTDQALHLDAIGDDHLLEAHAAPQQVSQDRLGQRRRHRLAVMQPRQRDMPGHDYAEVALFNRRVERHQLVLLQVLAIVLQHRQALMRVTVGGAVTRKVLADRDDIRRLQATNEGRAQLADQPGIAREAARADDGIARIAVDVQHRRQIHIEAVGHQALAEHAARLFGQGRRTGRAQRHVAGDVRYVLTQSGDIAAFLIDGEKRRDARELAVER